MQSKNLAKSIIKLYYKYGAVMLIAAFASIQFFLILRHKSPYLSDSYFYKHVFYQMKGDSFDTARQKVINQVDFQKSDEITRNFFLTEDAYKNSLAFFTKRPFYPFLAALISFVTSSEYIAFLTPVFFGYLFSVFLAYYFFNKGLSPFFSIFALSLFIAFSPLLDWSTYFLTDTIGFAFWLCQLLLIYEYVYENNKKAGVYYGAFFSVAVLNREQNLLVACLLIFLLAFLKMGNNEPLRLKRTRVLILISILISALFLAITILLKQPTFYDTLVYNQTNFGLYPKDFTFAQTSKFLIDSIVTAHKSFLEDLSRHHWWFLFFGLCVLGVFKYLIYNKKVFISNLMLSSGLASYLFIFFHPVLSYRYFFPVLITAIFFCTQFIQDVYGKEKNLS